MGALGLVVARWLVDRGARHLALVGRSGGSAAAETTRVELEADGAEVRALRADVADPESVVALLGRSPARCRRCAASFHAAGVLDDGVLVHQQDWGRFERVLARRSPAPGTSTG